MLKLRKPLIFTLSRMEGREGGGKNASPRGKK